VFVSIPHDSLTVRIASGSVQVPDTLHAVVRQTGGEWYLVGNLVLAAALILVTVILQRRSIGLQRAFNNADRKRDDVRERAVDARISAEAYVVRRTIRGWVVAVEHLRGLGETPALVHVGVAGAEPLRVVEEQLQRMAADAPLASLQVGEAVREAYVLYYKAKGPGPRPPESLADLQAKAQHVRTAEYQTHFDDLQSCLARLTAAIDPALRDR